jgi:hypothetical protein
MAARQQSLKVKSTAGRLHQTVKHHKPVAKS